MNTLIANTVTAPDTVLCFDRDRTIDVHPPAGNTAVPLAWLQYLAHHDDTHSTTVWATGNQHLRAEAGIPGLRNALSIWNQHYHTDVYDEFPRPSVETYKPYRREGLALIRTLYEDAFPDADITFIVVDDEPLDDLESDGWIYYTPWGFVESVQDGVAPVTVPDDAGGFNSTSLESPESAYTTPPLSEMHPFNSPTDTDGEQ